MTVVDERVLTVKDVDQVEGVSAWSISQACARGDFPGAYKSGKGAKRGSPWRIPESAIAAYRAARTPYSVSPQAEEPERVPGLGPRSGRSRRRNQ